MAGFRSCYKCGRVFAGATERVCDGCRKPRSYHMDRPNKEMSFRELQVAALVTAGLRNKEIAGKLCLTEGTIKEHMVRIFAKLGVGNRTALAVWYLKQSADSLNKLPSIIGSDVQI